MKNLFKLIGIIALAAVIGFSMTACDNGTTTGGGDNNRYVKLPVESFTVLGAPPSSIEVYVYADEALTQFIGMGSNEAVVIQNAPSNNKVYAVVVATSSTGLCVPKKFTLNLGTKAASEFTGDVPTTPKELDSITFGNVVTKTVTVSYDFTIKGAKPTHSGIEYMKPVVGLFFKLPGTTAAFDVGEVKGFYEVTDMEIDVPDFDFSPLPVCYSVQAYAEGAQNPTLKVFTTGGPDYSSPTWNLDIGEIVQTITGTVDVASFDIDTGVYTSVSVTIFTADGEDLGNGTIAGGAFSITMISANTQRAAYAMVIGEYYDSNTNTTVELVRYSTAFTIPAVSDPNQSVGALTYDSNRKHPAVTFKMNGGNVGGNTADVVIATGSDFLIDPRQLPKAVRVVHTLDGWNTKADGSGTAYSGLEKISSDITVHAQWEFSPITVYFYVNNGMWLANGVGTTEPIERETNNIGFISPLPAPPVRNGYRFEGWFTAANGTGSELTAETPVTTTLAIVYAKWTLDASVVVATVTFNANGGKWGNDTVKTYIVQGGGTAVLPEAPTTPKPSLTGQSPNGATLSSTLSEGLYRGGAPCTFTGLWNTQADGSGTAFTAATVVNANIPVYAQWQDPASWSVHQYNVSAMSGANFWEKAWSYINANAGDYILMVGSNLSVTGNDYDSGSATWVGPSIIKNASGVLLVGAGGMRTVSLSGNGNLVMVDNADGKLTLDYNITLQGHDSNNRQLVRCIGGQLVMNEGAVITGNYSGYNDGSGVYVNGGTFTMNGGTISGNTTEYHGGGVRFGGGGVFNMSGGTISNNTAKTDHYGGGIVVSGESTFNMSGGTISGNSAQGGGGVASNATFIMSGGTISGNTATENGGGVRIYNSTAIFRLITGTIYGNNEATTNLRNNADSGASLYVDRAYPYTGAATRGPAPNGTGTDLSTTNTTLRVVNGALQ